MNRIVVFGVAIFFALVGIALVGGERNAEAGLFARGGCNGCSTRAFSTPAILTNGRCTSG